MKALNTMWMILNGELHMLLNMALMLSKEYTCLTYQMMQRCILDQNILRTKLACMHRRKNRFLLLLFFSPSQYCLFQVIMELMCIYDI